MCLWNIKKRMSGKYMKIAISITLSLVLFLLNYYFSYAPTYMLLTILCYSIATEYFLSQKYYKASLYTAPLILLIYLIVSDHWVIMIAGPIEIGVAGMILVGLMIGAWLKDKKYKRILD